MHFVYRKSMGIIFRAFPKGLWRVNLKLFLKSAHNYFEIRTGFWRRVCTSIVSKSLSTFFAELGSRCENYSVSQYCDGKTSVLMPPHCMYIEIP